MHFCGCAIVVHGRVKVGVVREGETSLDPGHYVVDATRKVSPCLVKVRRLARHVGEPGGGGVLSHGDGGKRKKVVRDSK